MSTKTFTVRVPTSAPDTTSDHVSQWLESHLASPTDLASDPGAGERSLRLSLDREKVAQGAHSANEPEATFLRRLIATNVAIPQEEQEESKTQLRPRTPVLKGALKLRPDQIRPVVRGLEAAQSYAIRQAFHVPEAANCASPLRKCHCTPIRAICRRCWGSSSARVGTGKSISAGRRSGRRRCQRPSRL